jgi:hypothetical protein
MEVMFDEEQRYVVIEQEKTLLGVGCSYLSTSERLSNWVAESDIINSVTGLCRHLSPWNALDS